MRDQENKTTHSVTASEVMDAVGTLTAEERWELLGMIRKGQLSLPAE